MPQVVTQTISVSDGITETISFGAATNVNVSASTSPSFSYSNGLVASGIDLHYEHQFTLASAATTTLVLSALTDDLIRTVAFARVKRLSIWVTSKTTGDTLTVGNAATHPMTSLMGGTTPTYVVHDYDLKVALDAAGFVVTSGSADQLMITNSGAASMTFWVSISGCSA